MEGNSFAAPGHRNTRGHGNTHGPPRHFQGPLPKRGNPQAAPYDRHDGGEASSNPAYYGAGNHGNEGYPSYPQGFQTGIQKQWYQYANSQQAQNRKPLVCGPCNRTFYSKQKMDEHLKDHVECPFPECRLSAHIKIIDQHINNQHMLVNFAAIQIDDETWISERKKRFPTAQRAEVRRSQQMEKMKRGEKLGVSKKPFDKKRGDRNLKRGRNTFQQTNKEEKEKAPAGESAVSDNKKGASEEKSFGHSRFKKRPRRERPAVPAKPVLDIDLYESDEEVLGVPRFKGTKQFYESTGEMNYFSQNHFNKKSLEEDIAISDDEEWEVEKKVEVTGNLVLGGALGSLMGAYSDSEEEAESSPAVTSSVQVDLVTSARVEAPHSTNRSAEQGKEESQRNNNDGSRAKMKRRPRGKRGAKGPSTARRGGPRRRRTLLERLLLSDIIHERNIILQCVRHVVENNFFDDNAKVETDKEQSGSQEKQTGSEVNLEKEIRDNKCKPVIDSSASPEESLNKTSEDQCKDDDKVETDKEQSGSQDKETVSEVNLEKEMRDAKCKSVTNRSTSGEDSLNSSSEGQCKDYDKTETDKEQSGSQDKETVSEVNLEKEIRDAKCKSVTNSSTSPEASLNSSSEGQCKDNDKTETDKEQSGSQNKETVSKVNLEKEIRDTKCKSVTNRSTSGEDSLNNPSVEGQCKENEFQEQGIEGMGKEVANTKGRSLIDSNGLEKAIKGNSNVESYPVDVVSKPDGIIKSKREESPNGDSTENVESDVNAEAEGSKESEVNNVQLSDS